MSTPSSNIRRPFLVFVALSAVFFLIFAGWSAVVLTKTTEAADLDLAQSCKDHAPDHPNWRQLMIVATHSGGVTANFVIAIGGAIWMWGHHRRRFAVAWLIISIVGGLMILGLKEVAGRSRPPVEIRDESIQLTNESYPSGHAMGSLVGYGMLGFVLLQRIKSWPQRFAIGGALAAWVLLIGFSRIYLRAHWGSDVVGGWLLGLGYMNACLAVYFWRG